MYLQSEGEVISHSPKQSNGLLGSCGLTFMHDVTLTHTTHLNSNAEKAPHPHSPQYQKHKALTWPINSPSIPIQSSIHGMHWKDSCNRDPSPIPQNPRDVVPNVPVPCTTDPHRSTLSVLRGHCCFRSDQYNIRQVVLMLWFIHILNHF